VAKREVLETKISVVPQETKCGMAFDTAIKFAEQGFNPRYEKILAWLRLGATDEEY